MTYRQELHDAVEADEAFLAASEDNALSPARQRSEIQVKWIRMGMCTDALDGENRIGVTGYGIDPDSFYAGVKAFAQVILGIEGVPYNIEGPVTR